MPGSIQVSVLELMDLTSPPPLRSLSLKVVVGKREYHTKGGEDLSFPVLSLRENLIVAVDSEDEEEILRTEFRTMLLLERGFWDNIFPLKNGGSLNIKLQFSLSAEDRKRVREMRNSALKKKRMENHKTKHRRSFSDEYASKSGNSSPHTSEQSSGHSLSHDAHHLTEVKDDKHLSFQIVPHQMSDSSKSLSLGNKLSSSSLEKYKYFSPKSNNGQYKVLNNNVKEMVNVFESSKYQGVGPYLGQRQKSLASRIDGSRDAVTGERDIGNLKFPQTMLKSFSSGMLSQINSQAKSSLMESFFLKKSETKNVNPATSSHGILGSKDIKLDKKIHMVDIGKAEIKSTHNTSSHVDLPSAPSNGVTSAEIKDFTAVNVEKGSSTGPVLSKLKSVKKKENLNFMQMEGGSLDLNTASCTSKIRPSSQSGAELSSCSEQCSTAGKKCERGNKTDDKNANFTGVKRNTGAVDVYKIYKEMANECEKIEHPYKQSSLVEVARTASDEITSQKPSEEQAAIDKLSTAGKLHNSRKRLVDGNTTFLEEADGKIETLDVNENNNEEQTLRDTYLPLKEMVNDSARIEHSHQQRSSVEVARTVNDEIVLQIPSDEHAIVGILGTWTQRHLCITTGSNLLRDFTESFTVSTETKLIENSSIGEADAKKYGDANLQGNENKVLPSPVKNSTGSLKLNGGLIEQIAGIVIVIVACGLFLKSR